MLIKICFSFSLRDLVSLVTIKKVSYVTNYQSVKEFGRFGSKILQIEYRSTSRKLGQFLVLLWMISRVTRSQIES